jgi:hypothetical protein
VLVQPVSMIVSRMAQRYVGSVGLALLWCVWCGWGVPLVLMLVSS